MWAFYCYLFSCAALHSSTSSRAPSDRRWTCASNRRQSRCCWRPWTCTAKIRPWCATAASRFANSKSLKTSWVVSIKNQSTIISWLIEKINLIWCFIITFDHHNLEMPRPFPSPNTYPLKIQKKGLILNTPPKIDERNSWENHRF